MINRKSFKLLLIILYFPFCFHLGHTLGRWIEYAPVNGFEKLDWLNDNIGRYKFFEFKYTTFSLNVGFLIFALGSILYLKLKTSPKKYRSGKEHGSARYATKEEMKTFEDEIEDNNIIFTENAKMGLYNKRLPYNKQLNKNVVVIGGPGSGKTFTFVKPNAMQLNGSKVFTDTKELLVRELGNLYKENGYIVKVFDLIHFINSHRLNVFNYIKKETDIDEVAEAIVEATKKSDNKGEDFWLKAKLMIMRALIGYLYFDSKISNYEPSLPQVNDLIIHLERTDPDVESVLEMMFEELNEKIPNNYAYRQFQLFNKNFKGETRNGVKAILASTFSVFEHDEVRELLQRDTMEIETWNTQKTAVFINVPEVNDAYQFISSLLFSTIFKTTIKTADDIIQGKVNKTLYHLEIYGDEFAQLGKISNISKYLAVMRSREISMKIILQGLPQLDLVYGKEEAKSIMANCSTMLYLGTDDKDTIEYLSFRAGNETIDDKNYSENRNRRSDSGSTLQHSKLKRELLTAHEISTIDIEEALLYVSKQNVFRDKKYNVNMHKNKKYLANSPEDETWYRYKIYKNDYEEWIDNVKPENHIKISSEEFSRFVGSTM